MLFNTLAVLLDLNLHLLLFDDSLLHGLDLGLESHDFCLARVHIHLEVGEAGRRLCDVFFQGFKLSHESLYLIAQLVYISANLVVFALLLLGFLDDGANAVLELTSEFALNHPHFALVRLHLFLIVGLMRAVFINLSLYFLAHRVVFLDFSVPCVLQIVDLLGNLSHSLLEIFGQLRALQTLVVQHLLVFQVQVVVLFEDR